MQKNEAKLAPTIESMEVIDERDTCEKRTAFICHEIIDRILQYALLMFALYVVYIGTAAIGQLIFHTIELEETHLMHKHLRRPKHTFYANPVYLAGFGN